MSILGIPAPRLVAQDNGGRAGQPRRAVVEAVLRHGVAARGCPCRWVQFSYWAGKAHGPDQLDAIQNDLVEAALALPCFQPESVYTRPGKVCCEYVTCRACGTRWIRRSWTSTPEAFEHRLMLLADVQSGTADASGHGACRAVRPLTLTEWAEFMLGAAAKNIALPDFADEAVAPQAAARTVGALAGVAVRWTRWLAGVRRPGRRRGLA